MSDTATPVETTPATTPAPIVTTASLPAAWTEQVGGFATAVGKTTDEITKALTGLIGEPGADALLILNDPTSITDLDLQGVLVGELKIPLGVFRKNLQKLRGAPAISTSIPTADPAVASSALLPNPPDDVSFLSMLKVGGELKVGVTEVVSAVKTTLANRLALYDLPDKILEAMESFANAQDEPVGTEFFEVQKLVTSKNYGDILSALGLTGQFISAPRRKAFLQRVDTILWPALVSFNSELTAWQNAWMAGMSNPGMLMAVMASNIGGANGGIMPPGMMTPPDTNTIRDAAEGFINSVNKTFAGVGIPVARALAYDATRIKSLLENPKLPALVGVSTREQMIKQLGVAVSADYVRLERSVAGFALAVIEFPNVPAQQELAYLAALVQLGMSIAWDKLPGIGTNSYGRAGLGASSTDNPMLPRTGRVTRGGL